MSIGAGTALLRQHLAPHRRALRHLAGWSALEAVPAFASGLLVARAVDGGFLARRPLVGFGWLAALALLYAVAALGTRRAYPWLAAAVEPLRDSLVSAVVTAALHRAMHGDHDSGGASVSHATVQVETVRVLLSSLLRSMRQLVVTTLAALAGLLVLSRPVALVTAGFLVLATLAFAALVRVLVRRYRTVLLRGERVGATAGPIVAGLRDVVACGAEARAAREVGETIDDEAAAVRSYARAWVWRLPVTTLGAHVPLVALLALAPWLLSTGRLTVGEIAGGAVYLSGSLEPAIRVLVSAGGMILVNLGAVLGRLSEVCTGPPTGPHASVGVHPRSSDIEVRGVTFAYAPHADPVIRDLRLRIPEGLHLAVVGPSGVGKSTLANLLAHLATPQEGTVTLGGHSLAVVDEAYLRRTVALIPQEAYVFAGTLRENLTYLQPGASRTDLDAAVAAVGLAETLSRLGGYDAGIPPGGGPLSSGERQLIALARVYLSPARVVLLDEATCHLDPVAEARAEQAFAARDGTLVVIAHRISSAMRAHRILLMDGADCTAATHEKLLRSNALYRELVGYWNATDEPTSIRSSVRPARCGSPRSASAPRSC